MYTLQTRIDNWNLFRFFKGRNNLRKRPKISYSNRISMNEKDYGEMVTKKRIIDAKSEKNLAGLDLIKTTLLQWKEENDKIFTDYKTGKMVLNEWIANNELSQSVFVKSAFTVNVWRNNVEILEDIPESDSKRNEKIMGERSDLTYVPLIRQVSIKRFERTNSFRALGKLLITKEENMEKSDFF